MVLSVSEASTALTYEPVAIRDNIIDNRRHNIVEDGRRRDNIIDNRRHNIVEDRRRPFRPHGGGCRVDSLSQNRLLGPAMLIG